MRALLAVVLLLTGCSSILGISDPTPGGTPGDDGGVDAPDAGPHVIDSIAIAPDPFALPLGKMTQAMVIAHYADGGTEDITSQATFSLESGTAISVSPAGIVRALVQGQATIRASAVGFTDMIDATVGPPVADRVLLSVGNIAINQQQRLQIHATIVFTDGSSQDGTTSVTWSSSDDTVATVVNGRIESQNVPGPATITASASGVTPASITATVGVIVCHIVINEVQSGSSASASDEWAEIYNPCTVPIDVTGFTLNYRAATATGATDTNFLIDLVGTMAPGELRLYGGNGVPETLDDSWGGGVMQQNNGALGLRNGPTSAGTLIDSMAYGAISAGNPFIEGTATPGLLNGTSVSRLPFDGNDTNDGGTNFAVTAISTPRVLNAP